MTSPPSTTAAPGSSMALTAIALPKGVTVFRDGPHLLLRRRWRRGSTAISAAFWLYVAMQVARALEKEPHLELGRVMSVVVVAVLGYGLLAHIVNRSTVEVSHGFLTVRHGPIPYGRGHDIALPDIARIDVKRTSNDDDYREHDVVCVQQDGTELLLMQRVPDAEHAMVVAHAIREHLGMETV